MTRTRTTRSLMVTAALWALAVGAFSLMGMGAATPEPAPSPSPGPLTGAALAESLGLQLLPSWTPDCSDFVEVDDPAGYCIASVVTTEADSYRLGQLLRGHVPSDLELQIHAIEQQMAETPDDDIATLAALQAQLDALVAQLPSTSSPSPTA